MADKRIFTKKITESDAFLDMPLSAQCLYFHLNMNADDDGFVNNPKKVQRMISASEDDMKLLLAKNFLIAFEGKGVVVIKHWWVHNVLRKDRYKPTEYTDEKALLGLKENKVYTLNKDGCQTVADWLPNGCPKVKEYKVIESNISEDKRNKNKKDLNPFSLINTGAYE